MKLLVIIIRDSDSGRVIDILVENGIIITRIASTGGFLRRGNVTLLVGVRTQQVEAVIDLLKQTCAPSESDSHAVTIFTLDMSEYLKV